MVFDLLISYKLGREIKVPRGVYEMKKAKTTTALGVWWYVPLLTLSVENFLAIDDISNNHNSFAN